MSAPPFEPGYLQFLMRRSDVFEFGLGTTTAAVQRRLEKAALVLNTAEYEPAVATTKRVNAEIIFVPRHFEDKLFIRHLNIRLCRCYKVRHANREQIIRQIGKLLKADVPLNIVRTDIRRFFRNVDFYKLIDGFRIDGFLSSREIAALQKIADHTKAVQNRGLPWGLSLSSTLSEIFTRDLDSRIRKTEGIYYYQRFVDDIIIFSSVTAADVFPKVEKLLDALSPHLKLNESKTVRIDEQSNSGTPFPISYLGYVFTRPSPKIRDETDVAITISEAKIARYISRMRLSFRQFAIDGDWSDLKARIKLLTGNYEIKKSSHNAVIKTGIYYNYSAITDRSQLKELDRCLAGELIALRNIRVRKGFSGGQAALRELFKYSFLQGFERKILHRFSRHQLERLFTAWNHAR